MGALKMNTIRRYWRIVFPIILIVMIWIFSDINGQNSHNQSTDVANAFGVSDDFARTFAHFVLFGALSYSIASFVKGLHPSEFPNITLVMYPIVVSVAYGAIDEVHQLTIVGRNATIGDVFLDFLAGLIGTLVYVIIFCFWRRWRIRRQIARDQSIIQYNQYQEK